MHRAPRRRRRRLPERGAGSLGAFAQRIEALGAEAPRRQVHHALEGGVVAAVGDEAQVREPFFDLLALEKTQASVHLVGDARRQKRLLEHPRLRVRTVEDGDVAALHAVGDVLADAVGDELRLVALVEGGVELDRLTTRAAGPELLAEAVGVVRDQAVGGLENGAGRAVVLLELEEQRSRVIAAEVLQILRARTSERVHRLIVITHYERVAAARRVRLAVGAGPVCGGRGLRRRDELEPRVLDAVGVLELIHQHVTEAPAVMREQLRVVAPQLEGAQQQLGEVDDPGARARLLISRVQGDQLAARRIAAIGEPRRAASLVLLCVDEPLHLARDPARLVELPGADQLLDEALLVLGIHDLEALHQARLAPVDAQQAMRDAVEGADPERRGGNPQQPLDARAHLAGRLVGEGDGEDALGRGALGLDHPGDPMGEHARLAAAGARQHQHRPRWGGDGGALRVVQRIEDRGEIHRARILRESAPASQASVARLSCAKRTSATAKLRITGPTISPRMPNPATPPIAPMKMASVDTSACFEVRIGRSTFSATHMPSVHSTMKIAAPQRPTAARYSGEGIRTIAKAIPTIVPWMSAVDTEPNTTARVTSPR